MGEGGCVWVRWVTGGMSNTKTRQAGGIYGVSGQNFETYGRGNFPGHHVSGCLAKIGGDG